MKFSTHKQLLAINYSLAQAAIVMAKSASTRWPHEADYRDTGIDTKPVGLKRKKKWNLIIVFQHLLTACQ